LSQVPVLALEVRPPQGKWAAPEVVMSAPV